MVKLYLKSQTRLFEATGLYDPETNHVTVLKGAIVSPTSTLTRNKNPRIKLCNEYVINGRLKEDLEFNTPSTAATFVSGTSMNGYLRWKNEKGENLRTVRERING